jgi:omega-6 fatty acid desaturase (delta-12 desaturase)
MSRPDAVERARALLRAHRAPDDRKALLQVVETVVPLAAFFTLAMQFYDTWPVWLLSVLGSAAFKVRLFNLEHDAGHMSLFRSRIANRVAGAAMGVLTLTPQRSWFLFHNYHHSAAGNLDRRGRGDVRTLTVAEYEAASPAQQLRYRVFRHPLFLFGLAPIVQFCVIQRFAFYFPREWRGARYNVYATNLVISVWLALGSLSFGAQRFLLTELAVMWLAGGMGVWLFYIQHQLPQAYWSRSAAWTSELAAVHGSSYYDLPRWLHWLTANIGYHHLHHLNPAVPNHQLPIVHREIPELAARSRVGLRESLRCAWLVLWDEEAGRMVTFDEIARRGGRHVY